VIAITEGSADEDASDADDDGHDRLERGRRDEHGVLRGQALRLLLMGIVWTAPCVSNS
jgi:hypothetical protein